LKADTSAAAVIVTCLSWGVSVLPKNSHIYGVAKDHSVRAISSTFYGNVNVLALVTICDHWRGRVAEWFKAAVLKFSFSHTASFYRVPLSQCFRAPNAL
jgi:hypothetical protein